MYLVLIALITLITLLLPILAPKIATHFKYTLGTAPLWLPLLAAVLYFSAGFLPDIHISQETNSFQEHFVGGGLYTTVLFVYFSRLIRWQPRWLVALAALFAWTAALGVLNELVEFALVKLHIT